MKTKLIVGLVGALVILGEVWLIAAPQPQDQPAASHALVGQANSIHPLATPAATPTPTVGTPTLTPSMILVNSPTTVTITVAITPTPIANGVNLLRLGATGTQPTVLGVMHDDGKNGDTVAGDGVYTIQAVLREPNAGSVSLQMSVAFAGLLKRVTSITVPLPVLNELTDNTVGVEVQYPGGLTLVAPPSGVVRQFILQSTNQLLALGESFGDTSSTTDVATDGFAITIGSAIYTQPFDINSWLLNVMPDYDVQTITTTTVSGAAAYSVTFGDLHVPKPLMVIPHGQTVYTVTYTSTFEPGTPAEIAGLAKFQLVLDHFEFLK